ncbi:MAG: 30S ribosomal protein S18 [Candidatus Marinimicrobia bacterium]|mgnify:FL=1|nr:30S ribosomal protein S18 [Candidatus Neomarinimicrobiota bacterium]|tara:strand:+ start:4896 stop:5132 length:237 start_codon:yes stop_codon:yes gene_type:complete
MKMMNNKRVCPFKEDSSLIKKINYKEHKFLKKFITEQGKIIPGYVTGVSAKYQRMLTKEIKKARNIALLPYRVDVRNY